jgi:hypothetical protein
MQHVRRNVSQRDVSSEVSEASLSNAIDMFLVLHTP